MNNKDFQDFEEYILDDSFREYILGTSESSVLYWANFVEKHPEKADELQKAADILKTLLHTKKQEVPVDKNESLSELINKIENETNISNSRYIVPMWIKVAAVLMISVGLGWLWNWSYGFFGGEGKLAFNEIIVPIGEKSQIILADGTHVWINSGSTFKYPISFGKASREVYLSGEAFFDVKHRDDQTFVVNTHDARVKVLGTAFNVKAYPEDAKTQTVVVRGLVSVQQIKKSEEDVLIKPNQMAVIRQSDTKTIQTSVPNVQVIDKINTDALTCWKNQLLVFADEPLSDMALKMERWFNVNIEIADSTLSQERYNGKFVNNETIYEVLEAIKQTTEIKYAVEDNTIFIARNKVKR